MLKGLPHPSPKTIGCLSQCNLPFWVEIIKIGWRQAKEINSSSQNSR